MSAELEALCQRSREAHPLLFRKLDEARRPMATKS